MPILRQFPNMKFSFMEQYRILKEIENEQDI